MQAENLMHSLMSRGKNVRQSSQIHPLTGGCAVVLADPANFSWANLNPYAVGIMNGSVTTEYKAGQARGITFGYHAFRDSSSCSCSGGPGSISTPTECLRFTGLEIEIMFWRWKDGWAKARNGEDYREFVPLFEWYQSEGQAAVKPIPVSKSEWERTTANACAIEVDPQDSFCADWLRDEQQQLTYWKQVITAYALPDTAENTAETLKMMVYYKERFTPYGHWPVKPVAYFKKEMLIYSSRFTPLLATDEFKASGYRARQCYQHQPLGRCV